MPVTCAGSQPLFSSGLEPAAAYDYLALGLKANAENELPAALAEHAGLPGPERSGSFLDHLDRTLWRKSGRA